MLFTIIDKYFKDIEGFYIYDYLGITQQAWHHYKKKGCLPLKHSKNLCMYFGHHITDDLEELSLLIIRRYYREVV